MLDMKVLRSYNPSDWHEDANDERTRLSLTRDSTHILVRQMYPFRAKLLKSCVFNSHNAGHIFRYARTAMTPSMYPIQVFDTDGPMAHRWCFNSDEIEIIPATD